MKGFLPDSIKQFVKTFTSPFVSPRSHNEMALQLERLQVILRYTADGLQLIDKEGKIVFATPSVEEISGYQLPEIMATSMFAYIHPDDRKTIQERFVTLLTNPGKKESAIYRLHHKSGKWIWVSVTGVNLLEHPAVGAIVGTIRDITKEREALENLQKSRDQLQVILQNIADGIIVQDGGGKVIFVNPVAASLMGYSTPKEVLRTFPKGIVKKFDVFDEADQSLLLQDLASRLAHVGKEESKMTVRIVNKETKYAKWITIKSTTVYGSDKKPEYVVTVMSDITEMKDLEQRKNDFISMASHELKTPITSISLYNQTLLHRFSKDKVSAKLLEKMDDQLKKLTDLIKELLDVTNIQRGKLSLKKDTFYVKELAEEIIESLQPLTNHPLRLDWHTKILVEADKERIRQVLTNFVINAIKYSPEESEIVLRSEKNGGNIMVSVEDFGMGISKDKQKKIFDRFYQAEGEQKTYPGLGLGLYISSQIIALHNGKIWVESEEGKGSTFYFSLPIVSHEGSQ